MRNSAQSSGKKPKAEDYGLNKGKAGIAKKTAGKQAGKYAGQAAGSAIGGAIGSALPGAGTAAGAKIGGAVGKVAGKKAGGVAANKVGAERDLKKRAKADGKQEEFKEYKKDKKAHKKTKSKKRKRAALVILLVAIIYPILAVTVTAFASAAPAIAILQDMTAVIEFMGLKDKEDQVKSFSEALKENASEEELQKIASYEDNLKRALDCAVFPPSEREPGVNCIEGLIAQQEEGEDWSPVPKSAYWLVPVWQKAGERYGVPWQAIAAVNGARSNFGMDTCNTKTVTRTNLFPKTGESTKKEVLIHQTGGIGFYRIPEGTWEVNKVNAGAGNADKYNDCAPAGDTADVDNPDGPEEALIENEDSSDDSSSEDSSSSGGSSDSSSSDKMKWPTVPRTPISSGFGPRASPGGIGSTDHQGMDMSAPEGTKVIAVLDGKVKMSQVNGGYGNYILLDHGGGVETAYAHLSSSKVRVGQEVRQGQLIALSGNTGTSTGPHLHFEVIRNGAPVDPAPYLEGASVASVVLGGSEGAPTDLLADQPKPYIRPDFIEPLETLAAIQKEKSDSGNPHDAVDASFATAKALAKNGAWDEKEWKYDGTPFSQCDVPKPEGSITYPPTPPGMASGGSVNSMGIEGKEELFAKFAAINKIYKEHCSCNGDWSGETLPMDVIAVLAEAAGEAVGVNIPGVTMAQMTKGESGQRPGATGVDPGGTKGLGLWMITTGFNDELIAKYGGEDQMRNPIKNALAMAEIYKGRPGDPLAAWYGDDYVQAPNLHYNGPWPAMLGAAAPSGGAGSNEDSSSDNKDASDFQYKGKSPKDKISQAVRKTSLNGSDCYVAVVNKWYELIKQYPPVGAIGGDVRNRIVEIARAELRKGVTEQGYNIPTYDSGEVAVYSIDGNPWCQAFASRVWYWAGIKKELTKLGGMSQQDGKALPAHVDAMTAWGQANGKYKTDNPLPGDLAIKGSDHVEIVEKVANGKVVSTIGGNTSDSVARNAGDQGWTHFIEPPGADDQGSYQDLASSSIAGGPGAASGPGNKPITGDVPPLVKEFAKGVAKGSGLSESVVAAWALQEGGHTANGARFNFLNIGPGRTYSSMEAGIKEVLDLLHSRGRFTIDYSMILRSANKSDVKQIEAIAASPWCACDGYKEKILEVYRTRVIS